MLMGSRYYFCTAKEVSAMTLILDSFTIWFLSTSKSYIFIFYHLVYYYERHWLKGQHTFSVHNRSWSTHRKDGVFLRQTHSHDGHWPVEKTSFESPVFWAVMVWQLVNSYQQIWHHIPEHISTKSVRTLNLSANFDIKQLILFWRKLIKKFTVS